MKQTEKFLLSGSFFSNVRPEFLITWFLKGGTLLYQSSNRQNTRKIEHSANISVDSMNNISTITKTSRYYRKSMIKFRFQGD